MPLFTSRIKNESQQKRKQVQGITSTLSDLLTCLNKIEGKDDASFILIREPSHDSISDRLTINSIPAKALTPLTLASTPSVTRPLTIRQKRNDERRALRKRSRVLLNGKLPRCCWFSSLQHGFNKKLHFLLYLEQKETSIQTLPNKNRKRLNCFTDGVGMILYFWNKTCRSSLISWNWMLTCFFTGILTFFFTCLWTCTLPILKARSSIEQRWNGENLKDQYLDYQQCDISLLAKPHTHLIETCWISSR